MRLIGIGLFAFLLAGLTILLARSELLSQGIRAAQTIVQGPQLQFEVPLPAGLSAGPETAIISRAGPDRPVILSGLPSYQSTSFLIPTDAGALSGFLQIDLTTQVLSGVEAVLRMSIDNTRRAEVLLRPGEAARSLRIQLTAQDLARDRLTVSFSLQGTGPHTECTADLGIEAVVEIETTSALHLAVETALSTPRDRIAAWGGNMILHWPSDEIRAADVLNTAAAATRAGNHVFMAGPSGGGLSAEEARVVMAERAAPAPRQATLSDHYDQGRGHGALFDLRTFERETTWRIAFNAEQALGAPRPSTLDLAMVLGRHPVEGGWQVTAAMNGSLVAQAEPDPESGRLILAIPLPIDLSSRDISIEITARSTFETTRDCDDGPTLVAQLLPETRLIAGERHFEDPLAELRALVAQAGPIGLVVGPDTTPVTGTLAAGLLAALQIDDNTFSADAQSHIKVLSVGTLIDPSPVPESVETWLVSIDAESGAITAAPLTALAPTRTPSVSLLVQIGRAAS